MTAVRRRAQLGPQLPMVLAGVGSVGFGLAFPIAATGDGPDLRRLAVYAVGGGIDFIVRSRLLARRRRHPRAPLPNPA